MVPDMENATAATDLSLEPSLGGLEQRVQKLEEAVVYLQNTQVLEDRIIDRLSRRDDAARAAEQFTPEQPRPEPPPSYSAGPVVTTPPWLVFEMLTDLKN